MTDTNSTPAPEPQTDPAPQSQCMGGRKHAWQWVWTDNEWTRFVRCTTCGQQREINRWQGQ